MMQRREFITLLGGTAAAWPRATRAQQRGDRKRLIALLMGGSASDPLWQANAAVVRESLAKMGWIEGLNLRVELRFGEGDADSMRAQARELVRLAPEAILAATGAARGVTPVMLGDEFFVRSLRSPLRFAGRRHRQRFPAFAAPPLIFREHAAVLVLE